MLFQILVANLTNRNLREMVENNPIYIHYYKLLWWVYNHLCSFFEDIKAIVDESRWSILEILNSANILGIKHPRIDVSFMSIARLYRIN